MTTMLQRFARTAAQTGTKRRMRMMTHPYQPGQKLQSMTAASTSSPSLSVSFITRHFHSSKSIAAQGKEEEKEEQKYRNPQSSPQRRVLVLGSSGVLGSHVARHLSVELNMQVLGADVRPEIPHEMTGDWELQDYCALPPPSSSSNTAHSSLVTLTQHLVRSVHAFCHNENNSNSYTDGRGGRGNPRLLDAIICASGGWQGDPVWPPPPLPPTPTTPTWGHHSSHQNDDGDDNLHSLLEGAQAYAETVERMRYQNLDPVVAAAYVAQHYMVHHHQHGNRNTNNNSSDDYDGGGSAHAGSAGGLFVVMGATAALSPTPGMLGYGLAKVAAHHLVQTLGSCTDLATLESKSIRQQGRNVRQYLPSLDRLTVVGILPTLLDTPANRKGLTTNTSPQQQQQQWTKPEHISQEIGRWIQTPALRPHSGALIKVHPDSSDHNKASWELVR